MNRLSPREQWYHPEYVFLSVLHIPSQVFAFLPEANRRQTNAQIQMSAKINQTILIADLIYII